MITMANVEDKNNKIIIRPVLKYFDNFNNEDISLKNLKGKKELIFDLTNVEYISSNVLDIIKKLHKILKNEVKIIIKNCSYNILDILKAFNIEEDDTLIIKGKKNLYG